MEEHGYLEEDQFVEWVRSTQKGDEYRIKKHEKNLSNNSFSRRRNKTPRRNNHDGEVNFRRK